MIIAASRRTDIPAFYSDWFMNRMRRGYVLVRNPYYPDQISKLSLKDDVVDAIMFATKNPTPLIRNLDELDSFGIPYFFHFTITPYGKDMEPGVPDTKDMIETAIELSDRIGSGNVIWRYDPILISERYSMSYHKKAFARMCELLDGHIDRCVISFVDMDYKGVAEDREGITGIDGIVDESPSQEPFRTPSDDEARDLAEAFASVAREHGITIETCAEGIDLDSFGISHGRCVDPAHIERLCGRAVIGPAAAKDPGQRSLCGCMHVTDIGQYNTCLNGCRYCYANYDRESIRDLTRQHDKNSPLLVGMPELDMEDMEFSKSQMSVLEPKRWASDEPSLFEI